MPTLYHSTYSRGLRPLWTIEEMGIDCELVIVPFPPKIKDPGFLEVNPFGTVPMLVDGQARMTESAAIAEYLGARYGPTDIAVRPDEADYGNYLDIIHFAEATLTSALSANVRFTRFEPERGLQAAGEAYVETFVKYLARIEAQLADHAYVCADRFTIADICVCYALLLARLSGVGDRLSDTLNQYLDRQLARPAFQRARQREQPAVV